MITAQIKNEKARADTAGLVTAPDHRSSDQDRSERDSRLFATATALLAR